jgi:hypothetical protein
MMAMDEWWFATLHVLLLVMNMGDGWFKTMTTMMISGYWLLLVDSDDGVACFELTVVGTTDGWLFFVACASTVVIGRRSVYLSVGSILLLLLDEGVAYNNDGWVISWLLLLLLILLFMNDVSNDNDDDHVYYQTLPTTIQYDRQLVTYLYDDDDTISLCG